MATHRITVSFEVDDKVTPSNFHEFLCLAIHEGNVMEIADLVVDIQSPITEPTRTGILDSCIQAMEDQDGHPDNFRIAADWLKVAYKERTGEDWKNDRD